MCLHSKSAHDTKLSGAVNTLRESDTTQAGLYRLERDAHVNVMQFSAIKCKVLHLGWGNP